MEKNILSELYAAAGSHAEAALREIIPPDANPLNILDYFREFPVPESDTKAILYPGIRDFGEHKFYGKSGGNGGVWAIYSPDDTVFVGWLLTHYGHWLLLSPNMAYIDRWYGEREDLTPEQKRARADMVAGKAPSHKE